MSLLDLSLVTKTFVTLLGERIPTYSNWPMANILLASGGAPDLVNAPHGLSFYLYHVREDAHTKSMDWETNAQNPVRFKAMGLTLYYVMTPRSNLADAYQKATAEQLIMGLALKTLRDYSVIDDSSLVETPGGGVVVMPLALRGRNNRFRIQLQPTPVNEAGQYWQAGSQPLRLAAYYEVSATLLEPDELPTRSGRVLMVGVHTLVRGKPILDKTESTIEFNIPGENMARKVQVSPAQVAYGDVLHIHGSDLNSDKTELIVNHPDFVAPITADAAWVIQGNGSVIQVVVQNNVNGTALVPGVYGLRIRTTTRKTLPDGSQRDFDNDSNELPFAVTPQIAVRSELGGIFNYAFNGFNPHTLGNNDILMFVGGIRLTRTAVNPPPAGTFTTPTNIGDTDKIRFRFPSGFMPGSILPIRIMIRGAENAPVWETAP